MVLSLSIPGETFLCDSTSFILEYVLSPLVCVEIRPQDTDPGGWDLWDRGMWGFRSTSISGILPCAAPAPWLTVHGWHADAATAVTRSPSLRLSHLNTCFVARLLAHAHLSAAECPLIGRKIPPCSGGIFIPKGKLYKYHHRYQVAVTSLNEHFTSLWWFFTCRRTLFYSSSAAYYSLLFPPHLYFLTTFSSLITFSLWGLYGKKHF